MQLYRAIAKMARIFREDGDEAWAVRLLGRWPGHYLTEARARYETVNPKKTDVLQNEMPYVLLDPWGRPSVPRWVRHDMRWYAGMPTVTGVQP